MQDSRKRILLVDDDESFLRLLTMRLSAAGFAVRPVTSGEEALAQLRLFRPHVVVTDLMMDDMDGMTLFDAVHARCPLCRLSFSPPMVPSAMRSMPPSGGYLGF